MDYSIMSCLNEALLPLYIHEKEKVHHCHSFYHSHTSHRAAIHEQNRLFRFWPSVFPLSLNHSVSVAGEA